MIATELGPGSVVAGHRIESLINAGGMGMVFRAVDTQLDRRVALKVIVPERASDEHFRERFKREAQVVAAIDHPNIIHIWAYGEVEELLFVSMQYIEGTDLAGVLNEQGRLPPRRAARIVADVAAALDVAHRHGVVHRDVKPQNILLERGHDDERVILTDFGLAKQLKKSRSDRFKTRDFIGTPVYAAPEQMRPKHVDARADVYALGGVLFHAVTGRVPFEEEDDYSLLIAHATAPPPRVTEVVSDVPSALDSIVEKALAKNPSQRYDSAGDLGQAALTAAGQSPAANPVGNVATGDAAPRIPGMDDSPPPQSIAADAGSPPPGALPAATRAQLNEILRRAESHRTRHRNENALEEFDRALDLVPDSPDAHAGRGHAHLGLRRVDDALADFEAALRQDPGSIYALTGRGAIWLIRRRPADALTDYTSALSLDPSSVDALLGYAEALTALRRYAEARASLESALAIDAEALEGLRLRAVLAVQARRLDTARAAADRAVELDPNAGHVFATRAFVRLSAMQLEDALADLETACALDDHDASARALRGLVLVRLQRADEAFEDLDRAIELNEDHVEAYAWRAAAALWLRRAHDVEADLERGIQLHPDSGSVHFARALQQLQAGEPKRALASIDRALELDRTGVMTWFGRDHVHLWRARTALALGRFNEAVADCGRALNESPALAEAYLVRGAALLGLGRAAEALADLDRAALGLGSSPELLVQRSGALFELGRYRESLADMEAAVAVAPKDEQTAAAQRHLAGRIPLSEAAAAATVEGFNELQKALDERDLERADRASVAIVHGAAGGEVIDSEAKALSIEDGVLLKLDGMWRAARLGSIPQRLWIRSPEVSGMRRRLLKQSWLAWRLRALGLS